MLYSFQPRKDEPRVIEARDNIKEAYNFYEKNTEEKREEHKGTKRVFRCHLQHSHWGRSKQEVPGYLTVSAHANFEHA